MVDLSIECENNIFLTIEKTLKNIGLSYVRDLGVRYFYKDGSSFGICTNQEWKQKKKRPNYNEMIANFYANELLRMKRYNFNHSVRVQGLSYNKFLHEISDKGLGNVLVIYVFEQDRIIGYFFLAKGEDHDAVNKFHNDKHLFEEVVKNNLSKVDEIVEEYKLYNSRVPLFSRYVVDELFQPNHKKTKCVLGSGEKVLLTQRQIEIISLISVGCKRSKHIAKELSISPRTVDWYIQKLKNKFGVDNRLTLARVVKNTTINNGAKKYEFTNV